MFIDRKEFDGPLYEQIEEAYTFVLKHIDLGAEIKGLIRKDSYELPPEAIREAIVNAVTHRNLLDRACVQVAIFDDRVEITSPGMLYGGLRVEQIKKRRLQDPQPVYRRDIQQDAADRKLGDRDQEDDRELQRIWTQGTRLYGDRRQLPGRIVQAIL